MGRHAEEKTKNRDSFKENYFTNLAKEGKSEPAIENEPSLSPSSVKEKPFNLTINSLTHINFLPSCISPSSIEFVVYQFAFLYCFFSLLVSQLAN